MTVKRNRARLGRRGGRDDLGSALGGGPAAQGDRAPAGAGAQPPDACDGAGAAVRRRAVGQPGQGRARHVLRGDAGPRGRGLPGRGALDRDARGPEGPGVGERPPAQRARGRRRRGAPGAGVGEHRRGGPGRRVPDRRDHQGRRRAGPRADLGGGRPDQHAAAAAAELPVPARPVVLDLRWGHAQPDDQAGPQARDAHHGGDLPVPPDVRRGAVPDLAGWRGAELGPRPRRGRGRAADRQRHGHDRHGRADHAAGGAVDRPVAVPRRGRARRCWRSSCPCRAATCTWTR